MITIFSKIKGIYSKSTLFDRLLVVMFLFAVLLFSYIFLRKSQYITVTAKVGQDNVYYSIYAPLTNINSSGVPAWFRNSFYKGMQEKNGLGMVQAEVLDINAYYNSMQRFSLYLKINLKTTFNRSTNQYTYKGTPVVIGSKLKLYMDNVLVDALITGIDGVPDTRERKTIIVDTRMLDQNATYLETSGVDSYYDTAVNVGDEVKDVQGNTIVKVLEKKVVPAKKIVTTSSGGVFVQNDPIRKDISLKLELDVLKIQGRYFLMDDIAILIGQPIPVNLDTIVIFPTVTNIDLIK